MACPPQVPISILPPVSQGPSPILWQNGNQITRLNTPLNASWLVYDGTTTRWGDGSSQSPIYLPNLQQVANNSVNYLVGSITSGAITKTGLGTNGQFLSTDGVGLVWVNSSTSTANNIAGGAAGEIVYQTGPSATGFTSAGTSGQVLKSNGTFAPSWSLVLPANLSTGGPSWDTSGNNTILGTIKSAQGIITNNVNTGTALQIINTGTGGRNWTINSNGSVNTGGAGALQIYDATTSNTRLLIDTSGNVGIGTSSPSQKLGVNGSIDIAANGQGIYFTDASGGKPLLTLQNDNNLVLYGTNASGGSNAIFYVVQRTNSPQVNLNSNPIVNCPTTAKAWVNFNGITGTIRSSYNVSSITKNGTGDYTVNFSTAMANANYSDAMSPEYQRGWYTNTKTVNSFRFSWQNTTNGAFTDGANMNVQIFGS